MVTIDELEKGLKTNNLASIYLLFGEELFLLESNLKKIKKQFGDCIKGINYILLDEDNVEEIISDIQTPAFGYEKKLIIARDTGILKKEGKKKNAKLQELKEKLNNYITENIDIINQSVVIVFIEKEVEKSKLYKTIEKLGVVCEFSFQKPLQIKKRLKAICNGYKVNIEESTLQYFIECCGTDMQNLINEIRKLIEYVGSGGTIVINDIDKLCIKQIESVIFDLTDNLGKKNIAQSLDILHNLIYNKEPVQKILITLYNHFKKLYMLKLAVKYNKNIPEALSLKPNQMFLVSKYKTQANYFKEQELKNILQELIDLDYKYKIGLIDVNVGLESILCAYVN